MTSLTSASLASPLDSAHGQPGRGDRLSRVLRRSACHAQKLPARMTVSIPLRDSGEVELLTGHRVQHNTSRGPAKGGIRYHPDVDLDEIRGLAMWMKLEMRTWMAAYQEVSAFAEKNDLRLRSAATAMVVQRVSEAHRLRGLYP